MLKPIIALALIAMILIAGCNGAATKPAAPLNSSPEPREVLMPDLFSPSSGVVTAASGERETPNRGRCPKNGPIRSWSISNTPSVHRDNEERLRPMCLERSGQNNTAT